MKKLLALLALLILLAPTFAFAASLEGCSSRALIYGARWDTSNSNPALTRGVVRSGTFVANNNTDCPIQQRMRRCVLAHATGAVVYYLHPTDSTKKANGSAANLDGTDGQVMVEVQKFYYMITNSGVYTYFLISEDPFSFNSQTATIHPWFSEESVTKPYKYVGAFEGVLWDASAGGGSGAYVDGTGSSLYASGDKIHSVVGYIPMTYINRTEMRAACAVDAAFHQMGYWANEAILLLYLTEYATWYSQSALPGYTEGGGWDLTKRCKTGITKTLGNASGSITWGNADAALRCAYDFSGTPTVIVANSYRGIENAYGHLWKRVDGINIQYIGSPLTSAPVYVCNNPSQFADDTQTNYTDLGISLPLTNGYQSALHPGTLLPSSVSGGGATTYITDYFYASAAAGWRVLLSGGYLSHSVFAGFAYRDATDAASTRYEYIGGRSAAY